MMTRGGGATGAAGFAGAALCICATLDMDGEGDWVCAAGGKPAAGAPGLVTRGGTAMAGGAALAMGAVVADVGGTFGGITTTAGGRCAAATEAGVTTRGAGATGSTGNFGGTAFGVPGAAGASVLASAAGTTGLAVGRATGRSATPFCCVIARSTSPGREIFERSILVLIPSSPWAARAGLAAPGEDSERPRSCLRTKSASCSSSELECVFFSVMPTVVRTSRISLLLTSNSRARSLIRILLIRSDSFSLQPISRF